MLTVATKLRWIRETDAISARQRRFSELAIAIADGARPTSEALDPYSWVLGSPLYRQHVVPHQSYRRSRLLQLVQGNPRRVELHGWLERGLLDGIVRGRT